MKFLIVIGIIAFLFWYKPFDDCRDYSDFNCKQIENADYNVMFYFNSTDKSYNIGSVKGLDDCSSTAYSYANQKNLYTGDWSYVCCMKAKGSECYEKHR